MAAFTIALHNLRFFAHHGVFEEEKLVGNEFEVNLSLEVAAPDGRITSIQQTVNYATVHQIVSGLFGIPTPLLETLATDIADDLKKTFPAVNAVSIQIIKLHPPITAFTGSVSVTFQKTFN